jgi:hypothetical protein
MKAPRNIPCGRKGFCTIGQGLLVTSSLIGDNICFSLTEAFPFFDICLENKKINCDLDKPCKVVDEKAEELVQKGLTVRFRESVVYKKMVADILKLSPSASSFEIDTAIWWYMSHPDMFESEEGKSIIKGMEERCAYYSSPDYKETSDDYVSRQYPIPKCECDPVCIDPGLCTTTGSTGATAANPRNPIPHSVSDVPT